MIASRERQHGERVTTVPGLRLKVLPVAAIYGGNGSGKSNLYESIEFAKTLVTKTKTEEDEAIPVQPFRLDSDSESQPSTFAFEVLIDKEVFNYQFSVSRNRVESERLETISAKGTRTIFDRKVVEDEVVWDARYFDTLDLSKDEVDFIKFKTRDTLSNQLFLNAAQGRKVPIVDRLIAWFKHTLTLIDPDTKFQTFGFTRKEAEQLRHYCGNALSKVHTGIEKIDGEEVTFESIGLPKELKAALKSKIKNDEVYEIPTPDRRRYAIYMEEGQLKCIRLVTFHRSRDGRSVRFDVSEESEGTLRLIDLLPAFQLLSSNFGRVFIIDELDRSLHTLLTRALLETYLTARESNSRGQLIFTTHDGLLLDQSLFRRDEFWFIDKDEGGGSKISALSDFRDIRYDKDIRKSYLLGRFGGVPVLRSLPRYRSLNAN
jgi:AAA15 family ATPase/GTPase